MSHVPGPKPVAIARRVVPPSVAGATVLKRLAGAAGTGALLGARLLPAAATTPAAAASPSNKTVTFGSNHVRRRSRRRPSPRSSPGSKTASGIRP